MPEASHVFTAGPGTPAAARDQLRIHLATIRDRQPWENLGVMEAALAALDSYTKLLRNRILEAEAGTAENQTDLGRGCALGLRIAAALAGLPEGTDPTTRAVNGPGEPELIGPLTAAEWASFRLRLDSDDDVLMCCAETSDVRDAIFYTLRAGAAACDGIQLRAVWDIVDGHPGLGDDPRMRKLHAFYVADREPVSSEAALAEFMAPHPDFSRALIAAASDTWDLAVPGNTMVALGRLAGRVHAVPDPAERDGYIHDIALILNLPIMHVRLAFDVFRANVGLPVTEHEDRGGPKCQCAAFPLAGGEADCPNHVAGQVAK